MKTHIQIVAVLHIAMGALALLGAIGIFAFLGIAGGLVGANGDGESAAAIGIVGVLIGGFLALMALPSIVGGWALFAGCAWARPLVLVLAALHILNVPVGTALGIYTFWALLSNSQSAQAPSNHPAVQSVV
jgi:hypothetical protein